VVTLRAATSADCRRWWEWRNEPGVRAASFHPDPIPWKTHQAWFAARLADPACHLFIILDGVRPTGQLRFDVQAGEAEVHISLAPENRGHGCAAPALQAGCRALGGHVQRVVGHLRPENDVSIKAFARAGFLHAGSVVVAGQPAERMVFENR